ncbi:hypothetical protein WDU94_015135 [Cyamophila willieti]
MLDEIYNFYKYVQNDTDRTIEQFNEAHVDLQKFTKYKNKYSVAEHVPTDVVVVKFDNVASLWKTMWKYLVSVHDIKYDLEEKLHQTFEEARLASYEYIKFLEDSQEPRTSNGDQPVDEKYISDLNPLCKLVQFQSEMSLKFNDFSTLFLILEGVYVPVNTALGVICYEDEHYAFASLEEMFMFCKFKYTDQLWSKMSDTLRRHPELLDLFPMKEETEFVQRSETGIQTELHPIETLIDQKYHFNAHELMRRHRKQTESYLNCKNKGMNTCFLEHVATQTYDMRTVSTQESEKATSIPRPFRYIFGLRGFDNDKVIQDADYVPLLNIQLN